MEWRKEPDGKKGVEGVSMGDLCWYTMHGLNLST